MTQPIKQISFPTIFGWFMVCVYIPIALVSVFVIGLIIYILFGTVYNDKSAFIEAPFKEKVRWISIEKKLKMIEVNTSAEQVIKIIGRPNRVRTLGIIDNKEAKYFVYFLNENESFYKKIYFLDSEYKAAVDGSQRTTNSIPFSRIVWQDSAERYKMCEDLTKRQLKYGDNLSKIKTLLGKEGISEQALEQRMLRYYLGSTLLRKGVFSITNPDQLQITLNDNYEVINVSCVNIHYMND